MSLLILAGLLFCQEKGKTEEKKDFSASVSGAVVSRYLWRGQNQHDNAAFQPSAEAVWKNLTAGLWGSINFFEKETKGFAEADFYLSYDKPLLFNEKLALSAGYNLYTYPVTYNVKDQAVDHEFSAGLALKVIASPYIIYYLSPTDRFDGMQRQYIEAGVSRDKEFTENFKISLAATAGYALARTGDSWKGNASVLGLSITPTYSTAVDLTPILFYQVPLSDGYQSSFYAGLTVSYSLPF